MKLSQGDIVLLPVPFSNQTAKKTRPAIVISNNQINTMSDDVLLVPLTSLIKDSRYSVFISDDDLKSGRLAAPSRARMDKIFNAAKSIISLQIAALKPNKLQSLKQELYKVFE